jgi:LysM repeat protein
MNESTHLNSELLSADARGRKHIPVAVFAVILIHVVLFLVLLIAAGCRSSARAKQLGTQTTTAAATEMAPPETQTLAATPVEDMQREPAMITPLQRQPAPEPIIAAEAAIEPQPEVRILQPVREVAQETPTVKKATLRAATEKTAPAKKQQFYVVKSGDTLGEIAMRHGVTVQAMRAANKLKGDLIFPGQKLQLSPVNAAQAQPKKKRSNEV